jgi:hypothetical protein
MICRFAVKVMSLHDVNDWQLPPWGDGKVIESFPFRVKYMVSWSSTEFLLKKCSAVHHKRGSILNAIL